MKSVNVLVFIILIVCISCVAKKLPKEKIYGFTTDNTIEYRGDSLFVSINNVVNCPMRYEMSSKKNSTDKYLYPHMPIVLKGLQDTAFFISIPKDNQNEFDVSVLFGDPSLPISNPDMTFPFSSGRAYKIIQGNNSNPSHNYPGSRYAVDFSLQINDTICAAADGYVVAMVEGYEHGGPLKKWRPYSNYIFIYNAESNLFFNYGHLVKDGSFVALGDTIKMGQPIGLAGLTGYTTVEHLHFDVKKAVDESPGVISTIHTYIDGTKSTKLKRGMRVSRK